MSAKYKYIEWCNKNSDIPIFATSLWLEAVSKQWDVLHFEFQKEDYFLPYTIENKFFLSLIRNPHLTPYTYIVSKSKIIPTEVLNHFIHSFLKYKYVNLDFIQFDTLAHSKVDNHVNTVTKITHLLSLEPDIEVIYSHFKEPLKRQIKKATNKLHVKETDNIALIYHMHKLTYKNKNVKHNIPFSVFENCWKVCKNMDCSKLFFIEDEHNNCHAAIWLVFANNVAYYLIGGTDKQYYGSGAMSALMWHCIAFSKKQHCLTFDFEGSIIDSIATFFKKFNPVVKQYLSININQSFLLKTYYRLK